MSFQILDKVVVNSVILVNSIASYEYTSLFISLLLIDILFLVFAITNTVTTNFLVPNF